MSSLKLKFKEESEDQELDRKLTQILSRGKQTLTKPPKQHIPKVTMPQGNMLQLPIIVRQQLSIRNKSNSERKLKNNLVEARMRREESGRKIRSSRAKSDHGAPGEQTGTKNRPAQGKQQVSAGKKQTGVSSLNKNQLFITPKKIVIGRSLSTTRPDLAHNQTINQLSLHAPDESVLIVKQGKIQENLSYRQFLKRDVQPPPQHILNQVQRFIAKYRIGSTAISLSNIESVFSRKVIANNSMLMLCQNYAALRSQFLDRIPGLQYYTNPSEKGLQLAASKVQSLLRMNMERKYVKKLRSLMAKVKLIQRHWRSCLLYRRARAQILQKIESKIERVRQLGKALAQQWSFVKNCRRTEIHISSITLQEFKRLSIADVQLRQAAQITRIFKTCSQDCVVVYVVPFEMGPSVLRYYEKIFEHGCQLARFQDNLHFISVHDVLFRVPVGLSTAAALLYDRPALRKIAKIIQAGKSEGAPQPSSYIVPGLPSNQYTNLAAELGIPLFAPPQPLCKYYSTKSGAYELFRECLASLGEKSAFIQPRTVHGIYSERQLVNSLAILMHKHREVSSWVLKIDDEVWSRGLALLKVDSFKFLKLLRNSGPEPASYSQSELLALIAQELSAHLPHNLAILNPGAYPTPHVFLQHLYTRGGVIQEHIESVSSNRGSGVSPHSISWKIEPDGEFSLLCTYTKLQLGCASVSNSVICPSLVEVDNQKIVRDMYRYLWGRRRMYGYFTADFVAQRGSQGENWTLFLVGFDCYLNQRCASLFAGELVAGCRYSKDENKLVQGHMRPGMSEHAGKNSSKAEQLNTSVTSSPASGQKQVVYLYCPYLKIPALPHISQFFQKCKLNNISFDLHSRTGTLFLILDSLESESLGLLIMESSLERLLGEVLRVVEFLMGAQGHSRRKRGRRGTNEGLNMLRGYLLSSIRKNSDRGHHRDDLYNLDTIF